MAQEGEEKQEEAGKVKKQFESSVKKLVAILGDEKELNPSRKVASDDLATIVVELLKEEKEKNKKEVQEKLKNLLKGHQELKSEIAKKKKELEKLEEEKMKEFNKAANDLFGRIESIEKKERDYYLGLKDATTSPDKEAKD